MQVDSDVDEDVGEDGDVDDGEGGDVDCRASNTCTWRVVTIKTKLCAILQYHTSIMETYVSLAVLHQDVLLGVLGHPGEAKSR